MDSRYPRKDFSQLAQMPSSNFKRAGSGSLSTSKPHKARDIAEVSNRNTISKDSTQSNELCTLVLRNRDTISKDSTQSDGRFKSETQNRDASSKDKIESDKARITGTIPPNDSPGLYAVHQRSPAQQQQLQRVAAALQNGNLNAINIALQGAGVTPQERRQIILVQQQQRQIMQMELDGE
ncbi:hypothetical protein J3E69DRAFT_91860 [Trichoderma sp. SZMC 28015]